MSCYIVIVTMKAQSRRTALVEKLRSFEGFCPLTPDSWAIVTELTAKTLRDQLTDSLDQGDQLFVIRSGTEGAWRNSFGKKYNEWLKKNL